MLSIFLRLFVVLLFLPVASAFAVPISVTNYSNQYVSGTAQGGGSFDLTGYQEYFSGGQIYSLNSATVSFNFVDDYDGYTFSIDPITNVNSRPTVVNRYGRSWSPERYGYVVGTSSGDHWTAGTVGVDATENWNFYKYQNKTTTYEDEKSLVSIGDQAVEGFSDYQSVSNRTTNQYAGYWWWRYSTWSFGSGSRFYQTDWIRYYDVSYETILNNTGGWVTSFSLSDLSMLDLYDGLLSYDVTSLFGDFRLASSTLTVDMDIAPVPAPEPSTWVLLGTGLAGLAYYRRKKS